MKKGLRIAIVTAAVCLLAFIIFLIMGMKGTGSASLPAEA